MPIRITFSGSDKLLVAAFRKQAEVIVERLVKQLELSMIKLQSHIVTNKMSGQVLHHRTGKAAASIRVEGVAATGTEITGSVVGGGGPAWYLAVQEKGGTRSYEIHPVNKKALAFFPGGSIGGAIGRMGPIGVGKGSLRSLYRRGGSGGRELKPSKFAQFGQMGGVVVKYVIHPPLPARPVMSTGLEEMRAKIVDDLRAAVMGGTR
jgi:hypothetical protein